MASASKTPNLNLPQWVGTEKPKRTDFNAAFDAIDDASALGTPVNLTLLNGWTGTAQVSKNGFGMVRLVLNVMPGTVTTLTQIGTIPSGYRPSRDLSMPVMNVDNARTNSLNVKVSGAVRITTNEAFTNITPYQGELVYFVD